MDGEPTSPDSTNLIVIFTLHCEFIDLTFYTHLTRYRVTKITFEKEKEREETAIFPVPQNLTLIEFGDR